MSLISQANLLVTRIHPHHHQLYLLLSQWSTISTHQNQGVIILPRIMSNSRFHFYNSNHFPRPPGSPTTLILPITFPHHHPHRLHPTQPLHSPQVHSLPHLRISPSTHRPTRLTAHPLHPSPGAEVTPKPPPAAALSQGRLSQAIRGVDIREFLVAEYVRLVRRVKR